MKFIKTQGLAFGNGAFFYPGMARPPAHFRISLKDKLTDKSLKVELLDSRGLWGERRYRVRVNGKRATKVEDITLTEVFARLRRWIVRQARG